MDKKVSIIIPIYNVDKYLDECIRSAHEQSYSNIEIILVNDGSRDNSGKLCDEWKQKDDRIKVIHKLNGGLSSARNAGLDAATGEYVCFLDGDDFIVGNLLEKTVPHMDEGYELVGFCYYALYPDGTLISLPYKKTGAFQCTSEKEKIEFLVNNLVTGKVGWEACTRIFRRDVIENYKLRFEDNRKIFAEDLYFTLCYCAHINKILCMDEALYYYRQRQNSIMGQEAARLNVGRINELGKAVLAHYAEQKDCEYIVKNFSAIHFVIVNNVISGYQKIEKLSLQELRKRIIDDIYDMDFFTRQLRGIKKIKKLLYPAYSSRLRFEESYNIIQYVLDGNYLAAMFRKQYYMMLSKAKRLIRK